MHGITSHKKVIGDCEVCDTPNIEVFKTDRNITMCQSCLDIETKAYAQTKQAQQFQQTFKQESASVHVSQDIFNAKTLAAIELRAAIQQDATIPESDKEETFTRACEEHFQHFKQVVFDLQKGLAEAQNSLTMWQVQGQQSAGKLRADAREKYKIFDLSYKPEPVKTIKPKAIKTPKTSAKESTRLAKEAAAKYGLAEYTLVHMLAEGQNISHDEAARQLAERRDKLANQTVKS